MRAIRKGARCIAGVATVVAIVSTAFAVGSGPAQGLLPGVVPEASDDEYVVTYSGPSTTLVVGADTGLLANDSGPQGTFVWPDGSDTTSALANATVALNSNGSFTYQMDPATEFSGWDWFDYTIVDKNPNTNDDYEESFASAYIWVKPVVADDKFYGKVDKVLAVDDPGIYKNDLGIDGAFPDFDEETSAGGNVTELNDDGSFEYVPPVHFSGVDTFTYTVSDLNGDEFYTATAKLYVDSTAPHSRNGRALQAGQPVDEGLREVVRQRRAVGHQELRRARDERGLERVVRRLVDEVVGHDVDVEQSQWHLRPHVLLARRARDRSANVSGWSAKKCTAIPLRAGSLSYSSSWTSASSSKYFAGSARRTTSTGAKLTKTGVKAKYVDLVVTKCASCGNLQVRWNGTVTANISLYSPSTVNKQVVRVVTLSSPATGTVTATVTSGGSKVVVVEGMAAYRG